MKNPSLCVHLTPAPGSLSITGVAVEKLASEKAAKIKTRQDAPQTIFFDHLDIFCPGFSTCFRKKGVFQQPQALPPVISFLRLLVISGFLNIYRKPPLKCLDSG
jgi:hypothetical protein